MSTYGEVRLAGATQPGRLCGHPPYDAQAKAAVRNCERRRQEWRRESYEEVARRCKRRQIDSET